uniref:Retrotransposon gag domain-containing protein n=1 Tax=Peronospora matthiolae TaxID=2874970 RepID=A0AAV1U985_9STRA
MENITPLSEAQKVALDKLTASLGPEYVEFLVSQGPEVLNARVESFMQYEATLLGQVQDQIASAMPTRYVSVPDEEAKPRPLRVEVKNYSGKEGENLILWIREIEMAMRSGLITLDHQQVSLAISKLDGRAREWALTCSTSVDIAFPTWGSLKLQLVQVFSPPNQAYRVRSRFLSTRQGKNELSDYFQELRTLMAAMQSDPLPEAVHVTIFMKGLRTGIARTEVFRVHPSTFEEAVRTALNAEHDFKSAGLGWNGYNPRSVRANYSGTTAYNRPEPMDLSYAEDGGEAELQAAEQKHVVGRCFMCGSTKHLRPGCPLRKQRQTTSQHSSPSQKSDMARGNADTQ